MNNGQTKISNTFNDLDDRFKSIVSQFTTLFVKTGAYQASIHDTEIFTNFAMAIRDMLVHLHNVEQIIHYEPVPNDDIQEILQDHNIPADEGLEESLGILAVLPDDSALLLIFAYNQIGEDKYENKLFCLTSQSTNMLVPQGATVH